MSTVEDLLQKRDEILKTIEKSKDEAAIAKMREELKVIVTSLCEMSPEFAEKEKKREEKRKLKEAKAAKKAAKDKAGGIKTTQNVEKGEKKRKAIMEAKVEYVNKTPVGEKKDLSEPMPTSYPPKAVEAAWYDWWLQQGFFKPEYELPHSSGKKFVIVIPPPNVTGKLHLGHALTNAIQDTLCRYHRMKGDKTLWIPGSDHAGIATQSVVEKQLMKDTGKTRHDLGREEFLKKVWEWTNSHQGAIFNQLRRLASSLDWDREVFTMDEKLSKGVKEGFVQMYNTGLIKRDTRLINWCCKLKTALSDIEVDHKEVTEPIKMKVPDHDGEYDFGVLHYFKYPLEDGTGDVTVATTRIETMLADTAVAINPNDPTKMDLHGKFVVHPFNGRKLPIILDAELVDMNFGTGCVKITPAHDPNDFATGKRHNLEFRNLFTDEGLINEEGSEFEGMKRFDCRNAVVEALEKKGLFVKTESNPMTIPICSRSGDVIEPMIKPQWFVNCEDMANRAMEVVRTGELELIPKSHESTWNHFLSNTKDWCVSRQLWWGHRIPAYWAKLPSDTVSYDSNPERWFVGRTEEEALQNASAALKVPKEDITLIQDPDVLDTWFSSGLFPFSVFSWPDDTADLRDFFPTSLLETGHDILFFWVARMVMMSLQLTDKLPFKQVYLHAMVRDAHGKKMSKSSGNVLDPIDVMEGISLETMQKKLLEGNLPAREIERAKKAQQEDYPNGIIECGTDALRFALVAYTSQGRDVNLDINRVVGYRAFMNKLWNATRFAMMKLGDDFAPSATATIPDSASLADRWILSRLSKACAAIDSAYQNFEFSNVANLSQNFWQYDLCDNYLEMIKPAFEAGVDPKITDAARQVLYTCLETGLRMVHPVVPFVSEELWQRLARRSTDVAPSIMVAEFPTGNTDWINTEVESTFTHVTEAIHAVRSVRSSYNLARNIKPTVFIRETLAGGLAATMEGKHYISSLSPCETPKELGAEEATPEGCVMIVKPAFEVHVEIKGLIDASAEVKKLEKKKDNVTHQLGLLAKKQEKPGYNKAPAKIVEADKAKKESLTKELAVVEAAIVSFSALC